MRKIFSSIIILFLFLSCSNSPKNIKTKTCDDVFLDFQENDRCKKEYKNFNYNLNGVVAYVGFAKDNPGSKNVSCLEFESSEFKNTYIQIYFDRWINQEVQEGDKVTVNCTFLRYRKGQYDKLIIFHELDKEKFEVKK